MRIRRMMASTVVLAAAGLGTSLGATAAGGGGDRWLAPVDVRPSGGQDVRGVARLTGAPGGPAGIIAILIGLHAAHGDAHLAFGRESCDDLGGTGGLRVLPRPLDVAPDGSVRIDRPLPDGAAGARSLAVVGDWDGDGADGIGACGDLVRLTPVKGGEEADGVLVASSSTGDGKLLGNLLNVLGQPSFPVVLTSLVAGGAYDVGLSRRSCGAARGRALRPDVVIAGVVADERGTAYANASEAPLTYDGWRSLLVTPTGGDAVVACARTDTLEVALAG